MNYVSFHGERLNDGSFKGLIFSEDGTDMTLTELDDFTEALVELLTNEDES
jgi:hypothetical protein